MSDESIQELLLKRMSIVKDAEDQIATFKAAIKIQEQRIAKADNEVRTYLDNKLLTNVSVRISPTEVMVAELKPQQHAVVNDWEQFYDWLKATGNIHYLHKRVSSTAVVEAYQAALQAATVDNVSQELREQYIAEALPSGVAITEFDKVFFRLDKPKAARRVSSTT